MIDACLEIAISKTPLL